MKTLFSPTPAFSPQAKSSHAPQARQGTLVMGDLAEKIFAEMQRGNYIEETGEVPKDVSSILGLNPNIAQVRTFHVDSCLTFENFCKSMSWMSDSHKSVREAYINALNFVGTKDSEGFILLQIGRFFKKFTATGKHIPRSDEFNYGKEYQLVPGQNYLSCGLGENGYLDKDYLNKLIPLVAPIDNDLNVKGSIQGGYEVIANGASFPEGKNYIKSRGTTSHKRVYKGAGTPETVENFLAQHPDLFSDKSMIRKWYG